VAGVACRAAEAAPAGRPARLGPSLHRRQPRAGEKGDATTGPSPVNRGKPGAKHHLIVDGSGIPLAYSTTPGNRHDVSQLWPLLDRIPRDYLIHRRRLTSRGIPHSIARRGHPHGSGLGEIRYVVERSFAWLHRHRRLATCYERRPDIHDALFGIGCILICWRHLERSFETNS
jgi:transposase